MSDVHIKNRTWNNNTTVTGDSYKALDTVLLSKERDTDILIIGGDWFDSNKITSEDLSKTKQFISNFKKVYFIRGNHDKVDPSFLSILDSETTNTVSVKELTKTPYQLYNNVFIAGIPWMHSSTDLQNEITDCISEFAHISINYKDPVLYLVLHTSFKHLLSFDGSYKLTAEWMKEAIGNLRVYTLVGDIHTRDTRIINDITGAYIHSSGSLYPLSVDKTEEDYAMSLIDLDTAEIIDIPCSVRSYYTYGYTSKKELDDFVSSVVSENTNSVLKPYIRVIIPAVFDVQILQSSYPDVVLNVHREYSSDFQTSTQNTSSGYTIENAITDELKGNELLTDLCLALVSSDDPVKELDGWLTFWGVERIN